MIRVFSVTVYFPSGGSPFARLDCLYLYITVKISEARKDIPFDITIKIRYGYFLIKILLFPRRVDVRQAAGRKNICRIFITT
jgi:hypothetical protein